MYSLANGFAYWQYQDISNATKTYFDDMSRALGHVQDVTGSLDKIHFMNGGKKRSPLPLPPYPILPSFILPRASTPDIHYRNWLAWHWRY